jgi:protease II
MRSLFLLFPLVILFTLTSCLKNTASITPAYSGLGKESINPKTLEKYAPPSLSPELTRSIQLMLDVRSTGGGIPASNGTAIYFSWTVTGKPQAWKRSSQSSFPVQLTGGQDRAAIVGLTRDEKFLIISRDREGKETPGLYLLSTDGGPLQVVFEKDNVQAHFQGQSPDSQFIYYSANMPDPASRSLYRYDLLTKQSELMFDQTGTWGIADHHPNGDRLLLVKWRGNTANEFYDYTLSTKELKPLLGQDQNEEFWMSYGQEESSFFVLTNMFGNFRRLYQWRNGDFQTITKELNYDVSGFQLDPQRKKLVVTTNESGFRKFDILNTSNFKPVPFPRIDADQIGAGSFSWSGNRLSVVVEKGNMPPTIFVYDFSTKKLETFLLPSAPEMDVESFARVSLETYPARDGTPIPMLVRRPLACKEPCPVIVHFHGGPEAQSTPRFSSFAQIFVDAGFVYVEPNVRGSDGFGKQWLHADNGPKRLEVITDIEDAALYIKSKWAVNGKAPKVGVMGYSYGGYSTLMAMTRFAGTYDAGVSLVGMSNLLTFLQNTAPYRRHLRTSEYGDPEKDKEALIALSPITYLDRLQAPLLIIQGASDPRVPAGEAIQMHYALQKRGMSSQLILFANEGHGSVDRNNRVLEIGHTLEFFKRHL